MTARPTAPRPKTATEVPGSTLQVFKTAPHPVDTPHPSTQILLKSQCGLIFAAEIAAMTVYSLNVEQPIKWKISFPSFENLVVPSGITPFPCVDLILGQRFVFSL